MSGRLWQGVGVTALAAGGYYLYQSGGDPKAAEKRAEHDAASATQRVGLSGKDKEVEKQGQVLVADAGKKMDEAIANARDTTSKVDAKLETYRKEAESKIDSARKEAGTELNKAVDSFDKNVTEGASKAKSGISSWFGGGK